MASIHQFQKRAKNIKPSQVKSDLFKYVRSVEKLFIDLNIAQIEDSQNAKGGLLDNPNYSGVYSKATEEIASYENPLAPKTAGEPYNFLWTGEFIKGFELFIRNGDLELFSTGTGNEDKAEFFNGYKELFGLTDKNLRAIIESDLLPFVLKYYRQKLRI